MRPIPDGTRGSYKMVVSPETLANRFKDAMLTPVLATPVMIRAMENAVLEARKPYFEAGETAVDRRIDVVHLAPIPVAGASLQGRKRRAPMAVKSSSG